MAEAAEGAGTVEPVAGTPVSLLCDYVKKKGTCHACKIAGVDSLIPAGDFLWLKGKGQYTKKYHFGCFVPKWGSWGVEQMTPELQAAINLMKPEDRDRVGALFGGEQNKPERKGKKRAPKKKKAEEEEEEEEEAVAEEEEEEEEHDEEEEEEKPAAKKKRKGKAKK